MHAHERIRRRDIPQSTTHALTNLGTRTHAHTYTVSGLGFVLDFEFPEEFTAFTNALAAFNLSFFAMAPFECWFPESNFLTDLVFTTLWPIGTAFILLALNAHFNQGSFFTLFLLLTYLVLPSAASKIFSTFRYDSFCAGAFGTTCDGVSLHFLAVDY